MTASTYERQHIGGEAGIRFTVTPQPHTPWIRGTALGMALWAGIIVLLGNAAPPDIGGVLVGILFFAVPPVGVGLVGIGDRLKRRPGGSFIASKQGITPAGSSLLPKARIRELRTANPYPSGKTAGGWLRIGAAAALALASDSQMHEISYQLLADADNETYRLAGGMDEATALELQRDVLAVLGSA